MVNWPYLFQSKLVSTSNNPTVDEVENQRREDILAKLFAANSGISKLTGAMPESIQDMMQNEQLMSSLENAVNTKPSIMNAVAEDGSIVEGQELDTNDDIIEHRRMIESGEFEGVTEIQHASEGVID